MAKCVECGVAMIWTGKFRRSREPRCGKCYEKWSKRRPFAPFGRPNLAVASLPPVTTSVMVLAVVATVFRFLPASADFPWSAERELVWQGHLWLLLTTVFPHADPLHLLFNLFWIWRFGKAIERGIGPMPYAGLLVLLAIGSSAVQFLVSGTGIGLSGVAYGLFGFLYALRKRMVYAAEQMHPKVVQLFVAWFFLCLILTYLGVWPVGDAAHAAGAMLGWVAGWAVLQRRPVVPLAGLCITVVVLALATLYMPWNREYTHYRDLQTLGDSAEISFP